MVFLGGVSKIDLQSTEKYLQPPGRFYWLFKYSSCINLS